MNNQQQFDRDQYYVILMEDVRKVFIGFGKYLEQNKIAGQGSIDDYENYLMQLQE